MFKEIFFIIIMKLLFFIEPLCPKLYHVFLFTIIKQKYTK